MLSPGRESNHPAEREGMRDVEGSETVQAELVGPLRVLVVEDAPCLRSTFSRLLRLQGFVVREATDGQQAMDCADEFHPHLILTDLMMPIMDGIELIRCLRKNPKTAETPVVAITADPNVNTAQRARDAGAVDVIMKPFDLRTLLARLRDLRLASVARR
jgi:DNA-binding response OmpR family regulator